MTLSTDRLGAVPPSRPELPDLANLRDVGGLRTHDGGLTRHGRLWRSATPLHLDAPQARRVVDEVGIALRIDLRGHGEVRGATSTALADVEKEVLHVPVRAGEAARGIDLADAVAAMTTHYLAYLEESPEAFATIARAVARPGCTPALVHCTLGKDRTGAVIAVLLSAVGVIDEDVVADYCRTEGQNDRLLERLRQLPGYRERLAALPAESLSAAPGAMTGLLRGLQERYGGAAAYLGGAGVSPDELAQLGDALVEPAR